MARVLQATWLLGGVLALEACAASEGAAPREPVAATSSPRETSPEPTMTTPPSASPVTSPEPGSSGESKRNRLVDAVTLLWTPHESGGIAPGSREEFREALRKAVLFIPKDGDPPLFEGRLFHVHAELASFTAAHPQRQPREVAAREVLEFAKRKKTGILLDTLGPPDLVLTVDLEEIDNVLAGK